MPPELAAAKRGEGAALEQLLAGVRPRLYALAMRVLADPDEAEDAVQDAMVKVWKNLDGSRDGRPSRRGSTASV